MNRYPYVAVEGVIGVGKTSLARLLQSAFNSELMLEVFEENPFLTSFYTDRTRYAFQTQIFFLLSRYHQQRAALQQLTTGALIADYSFAKDALFARINLSGTELKLYYQLSDTLAEHIRQPDLLVYLRASTPILLQRIARRDRSYERYIEPSYIDQLNVSYDAFFDTATGAYKESRILRIDTDQLDFLAHPSDLAIITDQIQAALGVGAYQVALPLGGQA